MRLTGFHRWLFPELKYYASEEERKLAMKAALSRCVNTYIWYWILFACIFVLMLQAQRIITAYYGSHFLTPALVGGVYAFIGSSTGVWISRHRIRTYLRKDLWESGHLVCVGCGYDLRGQLDARCPECGNEFDLPSSCASGKRGDDCRG